MSGRGPRLWPRVVTIALTGAIAGWAGFTLYERRSPPPAPTAETADPRVAAFLDEGYAHLEEGRTEQAREAFTKASALAPDDGDVWEARLRADVQLADAAWRRWRFAEPESPDRAALLEAFDRSVDRARARIAEALRHPSVSKATRARLGLEERRLNALLIAALAEMGQQERAEGAFAARLEGKPEAADLAPFVRRTAVADAGAADAGPDGGVDAGVEVDAGPGAGSLAPPPVPAPEPFEFEKEPVHVPATPGELQVPAEDLP